MSRKQFSLVLVIFFSLPLLAFCQISGLVICEVSNFGKAPNFDPPGCQIYTHTSSFGTQLICSFKDNFQTILLP